MNSSMILDCVKHLKLILTSNALNLFGDANLLLYKT